MYRHRLTLALVAMLALVCVQAAFVHWGAIRVDRYAGHSRLTSDLLSELLDLSANKQRLRNWAAQQVMGAGAQDATRERLLDAMDASARRLSEMSRRHLESWQELAARDGAPVPDGVARLVDISDLLGDHIAQLRGQLRQLRPHEDHGSFDAVWLELNQVFDMSHGRDLRDLLNGAIDGQRRAVPIARAATEDGIRRLRQQAVAMVGVTFALALGLYLHLSRRLKRPLDALLEGTQALQAGRLDHRIPVGSGDEFDRVAARFNAMAQELQLHREAAEAVRRRLEDQVRARTRELEDAHQTLQRLDQRRRQLFADLGHELRTPATVIRGEADIALRASTLTEADYRRALDRIVSAVKQLTAVVDDLMLVARAEADELDIVPERVALAPLLDGVIAQAQALAAAHHQRLEAMPVPAALEVHVDPIRLRQALMIVVDNAIRYSRPHGAVRVAWDLRGDDLALTVRDDGIGIPPEELGQVFERFVRSERARRHRADGTGIGLSIAKSILDAHGGRIEIDSRVDAGTAVHLLLPFSRPA
ncbi:ATP-binding protein [Mitsuaria sp. GD03876]|uniref:sensor histidine kinase n=1 Tax=Mitsuaria sp. GD03876 TaxID=2975399 RepID=UPI0024470E8C|nr:ATP-binding protein [Mitsuaria sp. GD03876]MDH0862908.1 HAMP domain-containing histidine kinase [Mitsuaria sp. GD03876]